MNRFVAVDVEIASRSPLRICAIGAARFEHGQETRSYRSLVHVGGRVRYTEIHGLTASDLRHAPAWPAVWNGLMEVLGDVRLLVAFRASFDRAAILTMCGRYGLRLPPLRFVCAAAMIEARYGRKLDLQAALRTRGLTFPGSPHEPLADARAAAMLVLACNASSTAVEAG